MKSLWRNNTQPPLFAPLETDVKTDVRKALYLYIYVLHRQREYGIM